MLVERVHLSQNELPHTKQPALSAAEGLVQGNMSVFGSVFACWTLLSLTVVDVMVQYYYEKVQGEVLETYLSNSFL